jgi:hypothetical protein
VRKRIQSGNFNYVGSLFHALLFGLMASFAGGEFLDLQDGLTNRLAMLDDGDGFAFEMSPHHEQEIDPPLKSIV